MAQDFVIDKLNKDDREVWEKLWQDSVAEHGSIPQDAVDQTWTFLMEEIPFGVNGLCTRDQDGNLIGFLHYILHPVAGAVRPVCYMQDVYVDPASRRQGIATHMIAALSHMCNNNGWERIYWLVESENTAAQSLYNEIGFKLNFTLHAIPGKQMKEEAA